MTPPAARYRFCVLLAVAAGLSGCAVGPDFHRPKLDAAAGYAPPGGVPKPVAADGEAAQSFATGLDVPAKWWTMFHSPGIDRLVDQALAANPDLKSARAALRAAHELYRAQRGGLFPTVSAGITATRERNTAALATPLPIDSQDFSLFTGELDISYAPDVFGGVRRQIESAKASAENQKFLVEAAYLTLTANVVLGAIQAGALQAQIDSAERVVDESNEVLKALNEQKRLGQASGSDVAAQEAALASAQAVLPGLRKQLGQQEHLLAQLTGRTPAEFTAEPIDISALTLPAELPLSLPSSLVEQRPDIRAAEATMHAASAQVGVAIANRLPNISLTAALGGASTAGFGDLLSGGNGLWSLTGGLVQPLFDAGALRHQQHAAEAQFDAAAQQYRSTVLSAFQNVADVLLAVEQDTAALDAGHKAEQAARKSLNAAKLNLQQGEGNTTAFLTAQQSYEQASSGLIQAEAARYADTAALYQALGGGWWNRDDIAQASSGSAKAQ